MSSPQNREYPVQGAGLGLRRVHFDSLADRVPSQIAFMEAAPENWIGVGGNMGHQFREIAEKVPLVCHGLSLNLGGQAPLDEEFLQHVSRFLDAFDVICYSEHLSYCADDGHMYDLMPIPFTNEAVRHVSDRIKQVQDIIGRKIAVENVSYYAAPGKQMDEIEFVSAVLDRADCDFLLDVNNIYVNSINHSYDPEGFLKALPGERIAYAHIAGHAVEAEDLRVDTHGADVIDPVWQLLETAYDHFGLFPTLLERDFNIPSLQESLKEVDMIVRLQQQYLARFDEPPAQYSVR